jgi:hypothetical protein
MPTNATAAIIITAAVTAGSTSGATVTAVTTEQMLGAEANGALVAPFLRADRARKKPSHFVP